MKRKPHFELGKQRTTDPLERSLHRGAIQYGQEGRDEDGLDVRREKARRRTDTCERGERIERHPPANVDEAEEPFQQPGGPTKGE